MTEINIKDILFDFLKDNKKSVLGYLFLSLAGPISSVYLPHLYGKLISVINETKAINKRVGIRFVCIILLWIMVQIFWSLTNVIDSRFIPKLRSYVRKHIVERVVNTYKEDYSEEELGEIMAEIVRLPDEVEHLFKNVINRILPMFYLLTFSIGYFTWTNPRLGLVSIVAISLYLFAALQLSRKCSPHWDRMNENHSIVHGEINDCLGNLLNIYVAGQDKEELTRLDGYENEFIESQRCAIRCAGNYKLILNLSYIFLFTAINGVSFYSYSKGLIKIDSVISVLIITLELISSMSGFISSIDRVMTEISIIQHVQKVLDSLRHKSQTVISSLKPDLDGDIQIKDLGVKYNDKPIIKNLNLTVHKGQTIVLIGEIGSGKTSIINCLIRLIPYTGKIFVGGVNVKDVDITHLRNSILYVPQNPRLFNRSIYENIAYGTGVDKATVNAALIKYGMNINLDRQVGKFGQWLSGGQRQIVYLLRCLFKNSPIVLMDEPTASLDSQTKGFVMKILNDLLYSRTVIMITHDPEVIKYAKVVVELKDGEIKNIF